MLIIAYDPVNGKVPPDNKLRETADDIISNYIYHNKRTLCITVGSEVHVDIFRLAIGESELSHTDVLFKYKDEEITMNKYSKLSHHPWNCFFASVLASLIKFSMNLREKEEV